MTAKMRGKTRITKTIATGTVQTPTLSIYIANENGIHTHTRNSEQFSGKQQECPLCANGSAFEKALGGIGV
jgi:hypothetical protein